MTRHTEILREMQDYYKAEVSAVQARVILRLVSHVDEDIFRRACDEWMRNETWFPRANQILKYVKEQEIVCNTYQYQLEMDNPPKMLGEWWKEVEGKEYDGCYPEEPYELKEGIRA